jgi:cell division protein FtsB
MRRAFGLAGVLGFFVLMGSLSAGGAGAPAAEAERLRAELANANAEIAKLKEQLRDVHAQMETLRDMLAARQQHLTAAVKEIERLKRELARASDVLGERKERERVVPIMRGTVKAVDQKAGTVTLSVGERQGVEKGWQFIVFRGDQYVGKVVVEDMRAGECTARCVRDARKLDPEVGDDVTTRLNVEPLRAKVTGVDKKLGLVILNVGQRHGVKKGDRFRVSGGEKRAQTVIIDEVFPDMSAGHYDTVLRKGDVEVGDDASPPPQEPQKPEDPKEDRRP